MRYRLRTLLIVLALGPMVLANGLCGCGRKAKIVRDGMDNVDQHAKHIEQAAKHSQSLPDNPAP